MSGKKSALLAAALVAAMSSLPAQRAHADDDVNKPVRLIFDTDMGNDIDDALALAVIHAFQNRGEAELLCVTSSKANPWSVSYIDAVNTYYGRGDIPVGLVQDGKTPEEGRYNRQTLELKDEAGNPRFAYNLKPDATIPAAVPLLRKTLSAQPDNSVALLVVGFSTNAAALLESGPDEHSPLSGRDLVKQKVKLLSMMAGSFEGDAGQPGQGLEYNVKVDVPAARTVIETWPTPIVMSPWWIGRAALFPQAAIDHDMDHAIRPNPIPPAYNFYRKERGDHPTYDLTSVLYAVRPDRGYFDLTEPGTVKVSGEGTTTFTPSAGGNVRRLTVSREQAIRVQEALTFLASEPPVK